MLSEQTEPLTGKQDKDEHGDDSTDEKKEKITGIKSAWKWLMSSPWDRWPFALFLLFAVGTIVWLVLYTTDESTGYLLAALAAIIMALFGVNHFRTLLGLKAQVDQLHKNNEAFATENKGLKRQTKKLKRCQDKLHSVAGGLRDSNTKMKDNLKKFRDLDERLKNIADDSIEGLEKLRQSSEGVVNQWKQNLIRQEKTLFNKILDQVEYSDNKENMSEEEFNIFLDKLPQDWKDKFAQHNITFKDVAGEDGSIDYEEFNQMVDRLTAEKVTN